VEPHDCRRNPAKPLILVGLGWQETMAAFLRRRAAMSLKTAALVTFACDVDEAFELLQNAAGSGVNSFASILNDTTTIICQMPGGAFEIINLY
jgi:hypothetical protein